MKSSDWLHSRAGNRISTVLVLIISLAVLTAETVEDLGKSNPSSVSITPGTPPEADVIIASQPDQITLNLDKMTILGRHDDSRLVPGSVAVVDRAELEQIQPRSTEDVLRRVPGVYVKGEEESAVVVNVGVRGLPAGDYKTLVLEDGVPVQPGIFVGNARYYNPRIQRMDGMEVLKGASSLRYGPNTIGGVINYLTRTPEDGIALSTRLGSWKTREATFEFGDTLTDSGTRYGLIATKAKSDGFQDKGYDMTDVMFKAGSPLGEDQYIGLKFLYYKSKANISYRGLFPEAYRAGASYNPAPDDWFLSERIGLDLTHDWQVTSDISLRTIAYWSTTDRDYWRFSIDAGQPVVLNHQGHRIWNFTDEVQGNNRSFSRAGMDSRLSIEHTLLNIDNETEFGIRLMYENMDDRTVRAARETPRSPFRTLRDMRDSAHSIAAFGQNRFDFTERFSLTAGLRIESYRQRRSNRASDTPSDSYSNTEFMPGVGATYLVVPQAQFFASIYRAFAPPLVGSVVGVDDPPTRAERSVNMEAGVRGSAADLSYELTAFQMDFSNQLDPGVSGIRNPNEGSALIRGLELSVGYNLGWGFKIEANTTWIPTARYGEDRPGSALKGNRLSYSPEWMANAGLAYELEKLRLALLLNHTGRAYGSGLNEHEITSDSTGIWGGSIPAYQTLDLTAQYAISNHFSIFGAVKNLTDERYIAGLRQGIYAGPERSFEIGAKCSF